MVNLRRGRGGELGRLNFEEGNDREERGERIDGKERMRKGL